MDETVVNTPPSTPPVSPSPANYSVSATDSVPEEVKGWSWGGFLWTWIWAVGNNTWIGLLALLPFLSFIMAIVLGIKGREWAWRNKHWDSIEDFKKTQRNWVKWWFIIVVPLTILYIIGMIFVTLFVIDPAGQIEKANQFRDLQESSQIQMQETITSDEAL